MGSPVSSDDVSPSLSSVTNGTARKRGANHQAGTAAGTSSSSRDQKDSRTPSPTDSDYKSDEEIEAIIAKLPYWVDQLGGIRNLVIGGSVSWLVSEW